ncbi:putative uncharacterized protein DDB_G0282133 [Rhagoletis pomonella]|uniref:putative uncharacterized protein DDB_G0282133 n=1 Tax=Rhagoletis pomonella TaxID=28610 RepID=UPI00177DF5C9|nr:putative uncharacterized protein DDB_G0282133 [Rhagoletis pomonella]
MVAGNMKIITLTNATTSKSQNQNNFLKTNSSISKMNTDIVQNESPKMRYYKGNSYNSSDSVKSLQTPKQCDLNNKSVKKSHSHTLYNIPTTSLSNRKKFYQHRYHHSQQQHTFLNNKKNNKRNITTKNKSLLDSDSTNPIYLDLIAPPLPNQKVAKVDNCLMNVEDLVNNNNTIILDANSSCTPSSNNNNNCDASSADNSIALSSHRAKTQLKQHQAPSTSPKIVEPVSDVTLINQHDCISSIKSINLDCNSCWANLVTPQVSESQASLPWPWVHVSRHKSTSVSSTSSYSSSASSSILTPTGSNSDLLQNINAKYTDTTAHTCPTKKKSFRKGKTSIASRSYNTDRRSSSPHVKGQRKRRTYNIQTTADDLGDTKVIYKKPN